MRDIFLGDRTFWVGFFSGVAGTVVALVAFAIWAVKRMDRGD